MKETAHAINIACKKERSPKMDQNKVKVAELSEMDIESINSFQSNLKTLNDKDVILVAYEK